MSIRCYQDCLGKFTYSEREIGSRHALGCKTTKDETDINIDPMNELYGLLQEGIDDVENGRTKSMKDFIEYIREQIN